MKQRPLGPAAKAQRRGAPSRDGSVRKASLGIKGSSSSTGKLSRKDGYGGASGKVRRNHGRMYSDKKKNKDRVAKTKFQELLEMEDTVKGSQSKQDEVLEQRLSKKLKSKGGLLPGPDDGFNDLLGGLEPLSGGESENEDEEMDDDESEEDELAGEKSEESLDMDGEGDASEDELESHDDAEEESDEEASEDEDEDEDGDEDEGEDEDEDLENPEEGRGYGGLHKESGERLADGATGLAAKGRGQMKEGSGSLAKYVPPHLREGAGGQGDAEDAAVRRRLRGQLNRLSESNVEQIANEVTIIVQAHGRRKVGAMVAEEILGACSEGPRSNDQYASVFAAYVAGSAAMMGAQFGAEFTAALAHRLEEKLDEEDSLGSRNLALLFSHLYTFQLLTCDAPYDLLQRLCEKFREIDVATIVVLLQACGMNLRSDDAVRMKDFVVAVQQRTAQAKLDAAGLESAPVMGKRVQFMLDTICEIKNNRRRAKDSGPTHPQLKKWLQKLGVESVQLQGVTWGMLLAPEKRGQWWLSGGVVDGRFGEGGSGPSGRDLVVGAMDVGAAEADRMLQLAASQRMNTDARRAVFCVVMSGEDYLDAFEKVLRLKLPGKQDREVMRVIAECCMQERTYNPYYAMLASRLSQHEKNHRYSLQYCLWDLFRQLTDFELRRVVNLGRFVAWVIAKGGLSLSALKVVDFMDPKAFTPRVVLHFRVLFECLLSDFSEEIVWSVFSRIAATPALATLREGVLFFLQAHVHAHGATSRSSEGVREEDAVAAKKLLKRCKLAKKAIANVTGAGL